MWQICYHSGVCYEIKCLSDIVTKLEFANCFCFFLMYVQKLMYDSVVCD